MNLTEKMPEDLVNMFDSLDDMDAFKDLWDEWHDLAAQNEKYWENYNAQATHMAMGQSTLHQKNILMTPPEQMRHFNSYIAGKIKDVMDAREQEKEQGASNDSKEEAVEEKEQVQDKRQFIKGAMIENYFSMQEAKEEPANDNKNLEQFKDNSRDIDLDRD